MMRLLSAAAVTLAGAFAAAVGSMTVSTEPESAALTPFEQSLDLLPATALDRDGAMLLYVDMELAWQRAGVGGDPDERLDNIGALIDLATWTQAPQLFSQRFALVDEARAEVGFTMFDIDREVAVLAPPRDIMIAETDVPPEEIAAVLEFDPIWSPELTMVDTPYGGYFQWGDDPTAQDLGRISPFRPFGQGGQLALLGSDADATVVRTVDAADVEAVLSTAAGATDSLLDRESIAAAVAGAAGAAGVLQVIASEPVAFDPGSLIIRDPEEVETLLADMVLLEPYNGVVIVDLFDGAQTETKVLLVHADEAAADANADLAEQAIAEGFDPVTRQPLADLIPGAEVAAEGPVVVITLPFEGAYPRAHQMLVRRALFPTV
jgi:hypothetical protein